MQNLSEQDAELIAQKLEDRLKQRFYQDLGKGVWAMVWRVAIGAMVILAAYGAAKGDKLF